MSNISPFRNFNNISSPRAVRSALIEMDALKLRLEGYSYDDIAAQLGISTALASRAVNRGLKAAKQQSRSEAQSIRDLELMRLDVMLQGVWAMAKSGNKDSVLTALKIMDRRAKYLGLDTPAPEDPNKDKKPANLKAMSLEELDALGALATKAFTNLDEASEEDLSQEVDYGGSASIGQIIQMGLESEPE